MESELGVKSNDKTFGKLVSANGTKLLTFSELPINRSADNSTILERELTRRVNVRGLLITFKTSASSGISGQAVTSGQAAGTTTPQAASSSVQSVKITFMLLARKEDERDFQQVLIENATKVGKEQSVTNPLVNSFNV